MMWSCSARPPASTAARAARCTSRTSRSACWAPTAWWRGAADRRGRGACAEAAGGDAITCCFFGDGAINRGPFLEALNWARIYGLPVLFVCEDNRWSATTASGPMTAGEGASARAQALDIPATAGRRQRRGAVHETAAGWWRSARRQRAAPAACAAPTA
jgi:dihydroorotase-like cyclic amidohydrolase